MVFRSFIIAVGLVCLAPTVAFAQGANGGGEIGLGLNAATGGNNFGLALPIEVGRALRVEPGLFFAFTQTSVEGTNGSSRSETTTGFGARLGIHAFFAQSGPARAFFGADLNYLRFNESESSQSAQFGGASITTESETSGNGFGVAGVLGGEVAVAGNLNIGVRAGPQFVIAFPDLEDEDDVESASILGINGYGRIDATYYF